MVGVRCEGMEEAAESLFKSLEQVPDPRKSRGVRPPFQAILRLTLLGLVSGQTTLAHIALFGQLHGQTLKEPLGLRSRPDSPHHHDFPGISGGVPLEQLQEALIGRVEGMVKDQRVNAAGNPLGW